MAAFEQVQSIDVDNGSVGLSRNDGCSIARGTYIDLIDGDDLIGYSQIVRAFTEAGRLGPTAILVPKFVFGFGSSYHTVEYFNQDEIPATSTIKYPLYTAKIFAHRSLFGSNKYAILPLSQGYAYEDWHFNCNAMALGNRFFAVEGTALFYRQRAGSRNHQADQISTRQTPPSEMFQPRVFLRLFAGEIRLLERRRGQVTAPVTRGVKVFEDPVYRNLIARANAIDPAVDIGHYHWDCQGHYSNFVDSTAGPAYYRLCELVGDTKFAAVCLMPGRMPDDGADPVAAAVNDLVRRDPDMRILALFDYSPATDGGADPLLPSVLSLDLPHLCQDLTPDDRDIVCLKLLQACAPAATLHFAPSPFARRFFSRFGTLLRDNHTICYRPVNRTIDMNGFPFTDPTPFEFISENIEFIDQVIAFEQATIDADRRRLPGMHGRWCLQAVEERASVRDGMAQWSLYG